MTLRAFSNRFSQVITAATFGALVFLALPDAALSEGSAGGVPCPLHASELTAILGKTVQRVSLGDPGGDRTAQCSFAAVRKVSGNPLPSPQVFLTVTPGEASDLRELYAYYVKSRSKLATRPQLESRPDVGPGAFTLSSTTTPVTTAIFLAGKYGVATVLVDLTDAGAGKRDAATADKVFALLRGRLH